MKIPKLSRRKLLKSLGLMLTLLAVGAVLGVSVDRFFLTGKQAPLFGGAGQTAPPTNPPPALGFEIHIDKITPTTAWPNQEPRVDFTVINHSNDITSGVVNSGTDRDPGTILSSTSQPYGPPLARISLEFVGDPSCVSWGPNRIDCFVRASDNAIWHRAYDTDHWTDWESIGGDFASAPTVSSWAPGRLDIFVRGFDDVIYHNCWTGAWCGWDNSVGAGPPQTSDFTGAPACTSWGPNRIDCVITDATRHIIWHTWYDLSLGGNHWSGWSDTELFPHLPSAFLAVSGPAVASWGPNRLDIFVRGEDNAIWHSCWAGAWCGWDSILGAGPGTFTGDPSCVSWAVNRIDCFIRATDNAIWHAAYDLSLGGNHWSSWIGTQVGGNVASGPAVASWGPNRLDIFVRGWDNVIYHNCWAGAWCGWDNIVGGMSAPLTYTGTAFAQDSALITNLAPGQKASGYLFMHWVQNPPKTLGDYYFRLHYWFRVAPGDPRLAVKDVIIGSEGGYIAYADGGSSPPARIDIYPQCQPNGPDLLGAFAAVFPPTAAWEYQGGARPGMPVFLPVDAHGVTFIPLDQTGQAVIGGLSVKIIVGLQNAAYPPSGKHGGSVSSVTLTGPGLNGPLSLDLTQATTRLNADGTHSTFWDVIVDLGGVKLADGKKPYVVTAQGNCGSIQVSNTPYFAFEVGYPKSVNTSPPSPPTIVSFKANPAGVAGNPTYINYGDSATLSWQVDCHNSVPCSITIKGYYGLSYNTLGYTVKGLRSTGSLKVSPDKATLTKYVLTAETNGGTDTASLIVQLAPQQQQLTWFYFKMTNEQNPDFPCFPLAVYADMPDHAKQIAEFNNQPYTADPISYQEYVDDSACAE